MFTLPALLGLTLAAPAPADRVPEKSPLFLSVGIPAIHGQRVLPLGGSFPVVVTNVSKSPVKLWRDWCSWGYDNVGLVYEDGDKDVEIRKVPGEWGKNYPDAAEIAPGESMIFTVTLDDKKWENLKFLADHVNKKVKLRVTYHIKPDEDTAKLGVWTGSLQTSYQEYLVERAR